MCSFSASHTKIRSAFVWQWPILVSNSFRQIKRYGKIELRTQQKPMAQKSAGACTNAKRRLNLNSQCTCTGTLHMSSTIFDWLCVCVSVFLSMLDKKGMQNRNCINATNRQSNVQQARNLNWRQKKFKTQSHSPLSRCHPNSMGETQKKKSTQWFE